MLRKKRTNPYPQNERAKLDPKAKSVPKPARRESRHESRDSTPYPDSGSTKSDRSAERYDIKPPSRATNGIYGSTKSDGPLKDQPGVRGAKARQSSIYNEKHNEYRSSEDDRPYASGWEELLPEARERVSRYTSEADPERNSYERPSSLDGIPREKDLVQYKREQNEIFRRHRIAKAAGEPYSSEDVDFKRGRMRPKFKR